MGNIASVHLEKGHIGEFFHNDRSKPTKNSIFKENKVIVNRSAKEALELYNKLLKERTEKYTKRTGRKLQKKTQTLLSVVVNIKEDTTLEDLEKLAKKFEEEFGATVLQIAIHRDEGHITDDGKMKINEHGHMLLMGLDENGYSIKRKIKTRHLRQMQDWAAEILNMERGRSVRETKRRRLNTYEYKEAMKLKNAEVIELKKKLIEKDNEIEELKISKKELEKQISELRKQMIEFNKNNDVKEFSQEDYKTLSEIKKLLKANNTLEIKEKLQNFENEIKQRIKKRQLTLINKYSKEVGLISKEEVIEKEIAEKIVKSTCKTEKFNIVNLISENEKLKKENEKLKNENKELKNKIEKIISYANKQLTAQREFFKNYISTLRKYAEKYFKEIKKTNYIELNKKEKQLRKEVEIKHNIKLKNKIDIIDF